MGCCSRTWKSVRIRSASRAGSLRPTRGAAQAGDPIASVLSDPRKRALAAQILGQAFVTAVAFVRENKEAVERIADLVIERQELYGDELMRLLNTQGFHRPDIDWAKEETWPRM